MTRLEFNVEQETIFLDIRELNKTKGREYANGDDIFGNFNRLAARLGLTNLQVAWVYLTKHLDSIESYIRNGQTYSNEPIGGRLMDAINYLTLIYGMIVDNDAKRGGKAGEPRTSDQICK